MVAPGLTIWYFMGKRGNAYDMERDLEDMKDFLSMDDIDCPNCSTRMSPDSVKCPVCGFKVRKEPDDDFENKLKTTIWAPGVERGLPMGRDLPPPLGLEVPSNEVEEEQADVEELVDLISATSGEGKSHEEGDTLKKALSARGSVRMTIYVALALLGMAFYVVAALFYTAAYTALVAMILGTILVLVGGNLAFDTMLESKKSESVSSADVEEATSTLKDKLLKPGDATAKSVWTFVTLVGAVSYVLLPVFSTNGILKFLGMGLGSILIVLGVSFAHNAFSLKGAPKKKEEEYIYEAVVEVEGEEEEFEWTCPVCSASLEEDTNICPECGAEFED